MGKALQERRRNRYRHSTGRSRGKSTTTASMTVKSERRRVPRLDAAACRISWVGRGRGCGVICAVFRSRICIRRSED
jgi:hypothetical protein